jgi:hypothetical protein
MARVACICPVRVWIPIASSGKMGAGEALPRIRHAQGVGLSSISTAQ